MKKQGSGPSSKLTTQQVVWAARQFYEQSVPQRELAKALGVSSSYIARRIANAVKSNLIRVHVIELQEASITDVRATIPSRGQLAVAIDGTQVSFSVDLSSALPQKVSHEVDGGKIDISITRP